MSRPEVRIVLLVWFGIGSGCVWVEILGNQGVNLIGFLKKKKDMMEAHVN
jgi:hypothetical protein